MASPRLFRLRAEVAPAPSGPAALNLPYVKVLVDTGVFHLDQMYDYLVPERLSDSISLGVRVQVPFGGREKEGIVVERVERAERAGEVKMLSKILSANAVANKNSFQLIEMASQFYGCNPWDLIRSAIPPRVASVDKSFNAKVHANSANVNQSASLFHTLMPFTPAHEQLNDLVNNALKKGSVLIIAPDETDVSRLQNSLIKIHKNILPLVASMPREERYRNFLSAMNQDASIVIGTRGAVFAPVANLATIIIFKESSHDHQEIRSPGWNSIVIAKMRCQIEKISLILTGFSPSLRTALEIEQGDIKYVNPRSQVNVKSFSPTDGALLPGRIFPEIKKALAAGPVLFLAPRKGYGNALLCAHCRNIALCSCGGRLAVASKVSSPTCVHCGESFPDWKCTFCNRDKKYIAGRGIERASEEICRAFPGYPVIISAGDVIKDQVEQKPSLVLSTPGASPLVDGGYAAVVILDGIRFFSHTDLSAQERARELFLETASLINSKGAVILVMDESHPIVPALSRWNVAPMLKRELSEREELSLPPFSFAALLVTELSESNAITSGLKKALAEGRLPKTTRIYGPTALPKDQAKIVLHVAPEESIQLSEILHELQRRRSIAKKDLFTLRIDPFSL